MILVTSILQTLKILCQVTDLLTLFLKNEILVSKKLYDFQDRNFSENYALTDCNRLEIPANFLP